MTHERDVERLLDTWFSDGPREAPDRVLETVAERIHGRRQRPAWLLDRRPPTMSGPIRLLAIAAVLVGAVAIGSVLVSSGGQPTASPSPAPSAAAPTPEAAATAAAVDSTIALPNRAGPVDAGAYTADIGSGTLAFTLSEAWVSTGRTPTAFGLRPSGATSEDVVSVFTDMRRAATDEACTEAPEPGVGLTSADLLASFRGDDQLVVAEPVAVSLPGLTGVSVDIRLAEGATRTCPFSSGNANVPLVVDDITGEGPFWGIGQGEVERLWLLDTAGGHNLVIVADSAKGDTFDAVAAAAATFVDTLAWTPGPSATFKCNDGTSTSCVGTLDGGAVDSQRFEPAFTATIPKGWANTFDIYRTYSIAPSPHSFDVAIYSHNAIPEQNADCTAARKKGAGNSVEDWVTFLTTHPGLVTNTPVPVTVGGFTGQRIQFHVDPAWTERCPNSVGPAVVVLTDDGETPSRATWYDDHRVTAWILDVNGQTVIIHVASGPSSDANDRDVVTVQPILDSLAFKPAG